jgi:hypothetical protein
MRLWPPLLVLTLFGLIGCNGSPDLRPEPVDVKVAVRLPDGPATGLTVSFNPTEDGHPTAGKVGPDGTATVKAVPGKYVVFVPAEANASVPAFKQVPARYRTASLENTITLAAGGATVELK